jgi:hypothetical protein
MNDDAVAIDIRLTPKLAETLWNALHENFYQEQAERFEVRTDFDGPLPNDPQFDGGTMMWCDTASDTLMLLAYEQACGFLTTWLWDLESHDPRFHSNIVLSSRNYPYK